MTGLYELASTTIVAWDDRAKMDAGMVNMTSAKLLIGVKDADDFSHDPDVAAFRNDKALAAGKKTAGGKSISWAQYALERLSGFERRPIKQEAANPFKRGADRTRFAEFYAELDAREGVATTTDAVCVGPIKYTGQAELQRPRIARSPDRLTLGRGLVRAERDRHRERQAQSYDRPVRAHLKHDKRPSRHGPDHRRGYMCGIGRPPAGA